MTARLRVSRAPADVHLGDRGPDLLLALTAGTPDDRRTAACLIRTAIVAEGATQARHTLRDLATSLYHDRPGLAINRARAGEVTLADLAQPVGMGGRRAGRPPDRLLAM